MDVPFQFAHASQIAFTWLATAERKNAAYVGASYLPASRTAPVSHVHMKKTNLISAATAHLQSMQIAGGAVALVQMTQTANAAAAAERIQHVSTMQANAAEIPSVENSQDYQQLFSKWSHGVLVSWGFVFLVSI